ncbi:MAG: VanZ family protein [Lautropia sp.]|nr:VanZ family protein [Lautropia sp.]
MSRFASPAASRHTLTANVLWLLLLGSILYLSLFPLTGWELRRSSPWAWLSAGIPRFYSYGDLAVNVLAYAGFGFVSARLWQRRAGAFGGLLLATLAGVLLSFGMETLQSYLPRRVPSLLDLAANGGGALLGALVAVLLPRRSLLDLLMSGTSRFRRHHLIAMLLLMLWLLGQCAPQQLLLISAPLAPWPGSEWLPAFWTQALLPAEWQPVAETLMIGLAIVLPALLAFELVSRPGTRLAVVLCLVVTAMTARVLAAPHIYGNSNLWETYARGLPIGILLALMLLLPMLHGPSYWRRLLVLALIPPTLLLASLIPPDPGFEHLLAQRPSSLLMKAATPAFRSLLRVVSAFWPLSLLYFFTVEASPFAARHIHGRTSRRQPAV